ncbi:MAG TPA: [protein-PII] uridylyltransferase [Frankiaceae bacterium]|nr:[protein-PII] uridylyltransferase [Frankiaceae bacterium]
MRGAPTRSERQALLERADLTGRPLCRALTDLADTWLASLLGNEPGVALVGVGSVGRREVCPGSDLDLLLVHTRRADVAAVADRVWYPVWDAGLSLDHSVRTVADAVEVADADLKAVLGLLDARHVAGDPALTASLLTALREHWRKRSPRALVELAESVRERHSRAGEVAFLLEPDLKEGRGGTRDMQAMRAVAAAWVTDLPGARVREAYDTLLAVRAELHRSSGRGSDLLALQEQDEVARRLGHPDPVALMSSVAEAARTVAYATDESFRRVDGWLAGRRRRLTRPARPSPVAPGLALHGGELVLAAGAHDDPVLPWRAASEAAARGVPIATSSLERLAATPPPPDPWPPALRDALVSLLGTGAAAVPVMEALDEHGILVRAFPEWAAVRSRSQRNPYHRYTVDRHLLEAAAAAAPLARSVSRPDLLLVGTLLHDIGKGFPGDHTTAGMDVVRTIATRMGYAAADVETLVALVRHHLLLADVATRRDLDDPATVASVAAAVGDRETLHLLAALTEADGRATGPAAWNDWKAGLVADLVARTSALLAGARPEPVAPPRPGPPGVRVEGDVVTVVAEDRQGSFARVAGVLALHRLDVRSASAASVDGVGVQEFVVAPAFGREPDPARLAADIERALSGRLAVEARLAERAAAYESSSLPAVPPVVVIDETASETATVIEVRARDGVALLYRITRALADCDLDVRSAKVATLGHEVVDTFYVRRIDPDHAAEVRRAVLAALSA